MHCSLLIKDLKLKMTSDLCSHWKFLSKRDIWSSLKAKTASIFGVFHSIQASLFLILCFVNSQKQFTIPCNYNTSSIFSLKVINRFSTYCVYTIESYKTLTSSWLGTFSLTTRTVSLGLAEFLSLRRDTSSGDLVVFSLLLSPAPPSLASSTDMRTSGAPSPSGGSFTVVGIRSMHDLRIPDNLVFCLL